MELSDSLTTAKNLAVSRRLAKISRNVTLAVKAITPLRLFQRKVAFLYFKEHQYRLLYQLNCFYIHLSLISSD